MIRVADYIVDKLNKEGVDDIFMVTGRGLLFLTDAVAKNDNINAISVHNEQAGAYAAMGYAQTNDRIGACMVSTGCGSTNAITGVLCAYQDSVPCIFISGQNMLNQTTRYKRSGIRTYGSQEADIISIVDSITKYSVMLTEASYVAYELEKALYFMKSGRPGPVWIDVPLDIQNARVEEEELIHFDPAELIIDKNVNSDIFYKSRKLLEEDAFYIIDTLQKAKRPVLLIGGGVRRANATDECRELIEKIGIPTVYTPTAADVYGSENRLSIGSIGSLGGTREGNFALQNADLVISVGSGLSAVRVGDYPEKFAREAKIIVVDIDEKQHKKDSLKIDRLILADVKCVIEFLNANCDVSCNMEWVEKCIHWKEIFPLGKEAILTGERPDLYYIAERLGDYLSSTATVVCDAGFEELIIPSSVHYSNGQRCLHPSAQGAMGYALPAAIGAWVCKKNSVVAVIGDGSIMMNLQELETARYNNIPIKVIIINNDIYSVIRKRQQDLFRTRTIGTQKDNGVSVPDFSKVADCFGFSYMHMTNIDGIETMLANFLCTEGPSICEIDCVKEQRYLHMSVTRGENKKIVHRPLEDMSPFIDREVFLNEMIITPIDQ